MSKFRECPYCGSNIDFGERCDCQGAKAEEQREQEQANEAEEPHVLTMEEWEAAGDFESFAKPGDPVEEAIVDEFMNCVPPLILRANLMQGGEPYSSREDPRTKRWRQTYTTFERRAGQWYYCGHCFPGETVEPEKLAGATA